MIRFLALFALALGLSSHASAQTTCPMWLSNTGTYHGSASAACSASTRTAGMPALGGGTYQASPTSMMCLDVGGSATNVYVAQHMRPCNLTQCGAKSGQKVGEDGQEMSVPVSEMKVPQSVCSGACKAGASPTAQGLFGRKGTTITFYGDAGQYSFTGGPCTEDATSSNGTSEPHPRPEPLQPGQCPGTVNGVAVVVPCDSTVHTRETTTAPKTSTTASSPTGAAPGSQTRSTAIECSGVLCTTTTTTRTDNPNGTTTTETESVTAPKETTCRNNPGTLGCPSVNEAGDPTPFCEENPTSPVCSAGSFGGSCAAGFTCEGDAAACAVAREQHRRNCTLFDTQTALSTLGNSSANGQNPSDHPRSNAQSTTFALSSLLDQTPLFGSAGACPADVVVNQHVTLRFSEWCPYLRLMGAAWVAACMFSAIFIIFRK